MSAFAPMILLLTGCFVVLTIIAMVKDWRHVNRLLSDDKERQIAWTKAQNKLKQQESQYMAEVGKPIPPPHALPW